MAATAHLRPCLAVILLLAATAAGRPAAAQNIPDPGPDDAGALRWKGITLYGDLDLGLQYQTHGAPASDYIAYSTEPVVQRNSRGPVTALVSSPLSWSRTGIAGREPLGAGWSAVFRLETYFNPTSGHLSDGLRSLTLNNGRALTAQTANLDSSVAGQLFGGGAVIGLSAPRVGTFTFGRQATPLADGIVRYDPMEDGADSGHAFSLLGGSRTAAGGGTTEDTRLDHSVRFSSGSGSLHLGALCQPGGGGAAAGSALQGQLGASVAGASLDVFYARKSDAISASALTATQLAGLAPGFAAGKSIAATVSDNTALALMGLYELGRVRLFAGYERIRFTNPASPLAPGAPDIGGYVLAYVNDDAYPRTRLLSVYWGGLKWRLSPDLYLAASWYGYRQNSYATGSHAGCADESQSGCSGTAIAVALLADYRFTARLDAYLGSFWNGVRGGLASGYLNTDTLSTTAGVRLRF